MKKRFILFLSILLLALTFAGCGNTEPEGPGMKPPMLFVNDVLYLPGVAPWYIPELNDDWTFVGEIQSLTEHHNIVPTEHLQTNSYPALGAKVYHFSDGRIRISRDNDGVYSYREIYGDSLIVIANWGKSHFISTEARDRLSEIMADVTW